MSGETFGDGGFPCPWCKEYAEQHTLGDERDSRGHRKWICPSTPRETSNHS